MEWRNFFQHEQKEFFHEAIFVSLLGWRGVGAWFFGYCTGLGGAGNHRLSWRLVSAGDSEQ
jgi:hypothetical protein